MNLVHISLTILIFAPIWKLAYLWMVYQGSDYQKQIGIGFFKMRWNVGLRGEYTIYRRLESLAGKPRFLFNLYLPKDDGTFSEMDILMLHSSGLYAFESKNYKGWIFGSESSRYWAQTLPTGKGKSRKERFYNPIKQHQTHLKWLRHFLGDKMPICHSYIAFGDEASFKKLEIQSSDHQIVHYCQLKRRIKQQIKETGQVLTEAQIQQLFDKLYPLSQVETKTKEEHIQKIQEKRLETHSSLFQ